MERRTLVVRGRQKDFGEKSTTFIKYEVRLLNLIFPFLMYVGTRSLL